MESRITELSELESVIEEDMTIVSRLGLDGLKSQLDKHSSYLAERIESGRQNSLSLVEVAAGALAVIGTVGSLATIKYAR